MDVTSAFYSIMPEVLLGGLLDTTSGQAAVEVVGIRGADADAFEAAYLVGLPLLRRLGIETGLLSSTVGLASAFVLPCSRCRFASSGTTWR